MSQQGVSYRPFQNILGPYPRIKTGRNTLSPLEARARSTLSPLAAYRNTLSPLAANFVIHYLH